MKKIYALVIAAVVSSMSVGLHAQTAGSTSVPVAKNTPSPGLLNDFLRKDAEAFMKWDIGGQVRIRGEHKAHFGTAGSPSVDFQDRGGNSDNTYLLLREKFHIGYKPASYFGIYGEMRDSSTHNDDRNPNVEADQIDLHQAYVSLGDPKKFPVTFKIGRQEMVYGDERLIGASDWVNVGRVFDAARMRIEGDSGWVDFFTSRVIIPDDNNFNVANDYDWFSGIYASSRTLIPKQETELYLLARNASTQSPATIGAGLPPALSGVSPRDIYTLGLRMKSLPGQWNGWDYSLEMAGQLGRFKKTATSASLDHQAFAAHIAGGYTWEKAAFKPRVGLEYDFATGDGNPADGDHTTFENLFPTNHRFYGAMDFFSWQNIHDFRLSTQIKPLAKLTLSLDFHAFFLAETSDLFYQVNGTPRTTGGYEVNNNAGNYVGSEIDFVGTYAIKPYASFQAGYGHFFVGDYVKNSLIATGSKDAGWAYLQLVFNF